MTRFKDLEQLRERLESRLREPLPGPAAQALMSPRPRYGWTPGRIPDDTREAAALVLLYERRDQILLLLTQRREDLSQHAGQVSLPGGEIESGESREEAALREAREEVGLSSDAVDIVGSLSPLHIPASGFVLYPVVGTSGRVGTLEPCDAEVDRVLEVPLSLLLTDEALELESWELHQQEAEVPVFRIGGPPLWGATAMVVSELLAALDSPPSPEPRGRGRTGE